MLADVELKQNSPERNIEATEAKEKLSLSQDARANLLFLSLFVRHILFAC